MSHIKLSMEGDRAFHEKSVLLAVETSCDETSLAVLRGTEVLSVVVSSQKEHKQWGGVVPELASRAHIEAIVPLTNRALAEAPVSLDEIEGVAVTSHPGLIGALVVGTSFAKGIALRNGLPLVSVNHIEGHIFSGMLEHSDVQFPFVALVVSGGHTSIFVVENAHQYTAVGSTVDDAAGEAFDKIAKMLGLGYPGGARIDSYAQKGKSEAFDFPRPMLHHDNFNFSFSGLKTAVRVFLGKNYPEGVPEEALPDICASAQEAIVEVLVRKTMAAARKHNVADIVVAGGVSANSRLREAFAEAGKRHKKRIIVPSPLYCTDNAAMIGFVGRLKLLEKTAYKGVRFTAQAAALRA